ncbi:MAG: hypothetical protein U9N81_05210 [Bacillota bacterium]|nr:hypothetical protein [Bacillota bacterium]
MKRYVRIIVTVGLVCILAIMTVVIWQYHNQINALTQENQILANEKTELASEIKDLRAEIRKRDDLISTLPRLDNLRRNGFTGSPEDIALDLKTHNELIPYEGILGGTMRFFGSDHIFVLTDRWVLAYFEDGHIGGYLLLEYKIENGTISYTVIDSYLM